MLHLKVQTPSNFHKLYFVDKTSKASNYIWNNKLKLRENQLDYKCLIITISELQMKDLILMADITGCSGRVEMILLDIETEISHILKYLTEYLEEE